LLGRSSHGFYCNTLTSRSGAETERKWPGAARAPAEVDATKDRTCDANDRAWPVELVG
jgi:hypothetical protein